MAVHVVRLPDVGEGVAQAELVQWFVAVGDAVTSESQLAEVVTDKATVEIVSPVAGTVQYLRGEPGDVLAVGSDLVGIEVDAEETTDARRQSPEWADPAPAATEQVEAAAPVEGPESASSAAPRGPTSQTKTTARLGDRPHRDITDRPIASPAVRKAATERGIDLRLVHGSGSAGRILPPDLDAFEMGDRRIVPFPDELSDTETSIRGVRRTIAERMTMAWRIPHITYVEEVDLTELEKVRAALNERADDASDHLTVLPFIARAVVIACREHPHLNATFDDESGTLTKHGAVHVGIATQTDAGLVVPVVRHAEAMPISALAEEIARLSMAARARQATRDELSGSTITVSSLGRLGGVASTPIINHPEVAIIGVNRLQIRPVWNGASFAPRTVMNLSSSFDHRVVDGWDAAVFVQRIKQLLEMPALFFVGERIS